MNREPWSERDTAILDRMAKAGATNEAIGDAVRRSADAVRFKRKARRLPPAPSRQPKPKPLKKPKADERIREQEVETKVTQDGTEARSTGTKIRTVDDLLKHINADLTHFEVATSEATKWEQASKDPLTGKVTVTELHRVFVKLRPKAGPSVIETVEAMIAGAVAPRKAAKVVSIGRGEPHILQAVVIADPHIGKYAWDRETGWGDYDTAIATRLLRDCGGQLVADGASRKVGRRALWLLGDIFHYDTPQGSTTGGTALDRDGRVEKMIEEGSGALLDLISQSAESAPTDVVLVPGNHDALLTVALRQILTAYFRKDKRVSVDARGTSRKYVRHGRCLFGLTHGDKAQKRLGELMSVEAGADWGETTYREVHHGHKHSEAAVETVAGVVIRQHPALCPPDGWHASEGFVGAPRAMQAYYYHAQGGLIGTTVASPDLGAKVRRGVAA